MANHYFIVADFGDFCEGNQGRIHNENEGIHLFDNVVRECKEKKLTVKVSLCRNATDIKTIMLRNGSEIKTAV